MVCFLGLMGGSNAMARSAVCKDFTSITPSISVSFPEQNNPYLFDLLQSRQAAVLRMLGGSLTPSRLHFADPARAAFTFNTAVDRQIQVGVLAPDDAIYWGESHVGRSGELIFVRWGGQAPDGSIGKLGEVEFRVVRMPRDGAVTYERAHAENAHLPKATSYLSASDFRRALSERILPGSIDGSQSIAHRAAKFLLQPEPIFVHDAAHAGGLLEHPGAAAPIKRAMSRALEDQSMDIFTNQHEARLIYALELMPAFANGADHQFAHLLELHGLEFSAVTTLERAELAVNGCANLDEISLAVTRFHVNQRSPFGAILRSALSDARLFSRLDRLYEQITSGARALRRATLRATPLALAQSQLRARLVKNVAEYLFAARALSQTSFKGWFALASSERDAEGPYRDFLCVGEIPEVFSEHFCREIRSTSRLAQARNIK